MQNQQRNTGADGDHDQPHGGSGKIFSPDGLGEHLPHSLLGYINQLADVHHRVGNTVRIADQ